MIGTLNAPKKCAPPQWAAITEDACAAWCSVQRRIPFRIICGEERDSIIPKKERAPDIRELFSTNYKLKL